MTKDLLFQTLEPTIVELKHESFTKYCNELGIRHNFSAPRTPQQNGVVERKNKTL